MLGKGHGGLYKAPTKQEEETRKVSGKEEGRTFHKLRVLGMNDDLRDRVRELAGGGLVGENHVRVHSFWCS